MDIIPTDSSRILSLLVSAIVIGALVRLSKADVKWFIDVPSRWRPVVAVALGIPASVVDHVLHGTPWKEALLLGLLAGALSITGHDVGIHAFLGGREVPVPSARTPKQSPSDTRSDSVDGADKSTGNEDNKNPGADSK